ncbi:hypothetical protein [uncultured Desulfobacter sp.]|uniref:hypothetical protein n=1 Tax=uncultured Desulfobacter sp. TaxID=240139 RepID=UPI002AABCA13|nr:hypothetical protein [uncultured Desulfobacter sp.]
MYFSAEFQLGNPGIYYQFKLRENESEPFFALVTKNSTALQTLRSGDLVPMIFHYQDKTIPAVHKTTRIKYILDGTPIGFKDHFMIGLDIDRVGE